RSGAGANIWSGPVTLTNAGINSTVALGVDAGSLAINAAIGQTAGVNVVKVGPGTLVFGGTTANTFNGGTTTIAEGGRGLNKTPGGNALNAQTIVVGDNVGAGTDQLVWMASNQLNNQSFPTTVQGSGVLNLNNFSDTIANTVTVVSGLAASASVATGTG